MIDRLLLQEFQAHQEAEFNLSPIVVFVGDNGSGKSSVIRAIRWLLLNKPSGSAVVRWGSKKCRVQARIDGRRIGKSRVSGSLKYKFEDQEFSAVGTSVPEPIADVLSVSERINFQGQHDSPFLLDLSAGQVAQELNKIVDLELVDRTISAANKEVRARRLAVEVASQRVEEKEARVREVCFARELLEDVKVLEELQERTMGPVEERRVLHEFVKKARVHEKYVKGFEAAGSLCEEIESIGQRALQLLAEVRQLEHTVQQIQKTRIILDCKAPDLPEASYEKMKASKSALGSYQALLEEALRCEKEFSSLQKQEKRAERFLSEFTLCPTCGGLVL